MPGFIAVFLPGGGAVETAGEDAFLKYQYASDQRTVTGTPFGYGVGDLHEIRVPFWAHQIDSLTWNWRDYTFESKRRRINQRRLFDHIISCYLPN